MSDVDDMSFEILGTASMHSYDENRPGEIASSENSLRPGRSALSNGVERDMDRMRLSESNSGGLKSPLSQSNKENRPSDVALDILLRRKTPADLMQSLKLPSLNAEFPSLSNANLTEEDFNKLQTIIAEHQHLKENLLKANAVIRQYFGAVEKWQNDVKQAKDEDKKRLSLFLENNQKLQNEVRRLQMELEESKQTQNQRQNDVVMATESQEVTKLRQELVQMRNGSSQEMVPRQTYKNVERQCSQLLAENLQFKDMEQQYISEINCLKANHASTEELVRMGQSDLNAERVANHKIMQELNNVREENQVLIQQAEIYQKDFIAERDARQRMAGEKEEVITELNRLRMMLRTPQPQMGGGAGGHCGLVRHTCPNCYSQFSNQQLLSLHLPQCGRHN